MPPSRPPVSKAISSEILPTTMSAESGVTAGTATVPALGSALRNDPGRGIAYMLLGVGLFACMDAMVKWLGAFYPTIQLVFFRSLFAFIPLSFIIIPAGVKVLRTQHLRGHTARSLIGLTSMTCFFYAFSQMKLADVVAIGFAAPLFVTALSVPMLGEAVGIRRWSAVIVGFIGTLIMTNPSSGVLSLVTLVALAGTFTYALAIVMIRLLSRSEAPVTIVFYFTLSCTVISGLALPFVWMTPTLPHFFMLAGVGLLGGCAQLAMTHAFRAAPLPVVAPFDYLAMLYAAAIGWMVWGELPQSQIWVGAVIVMASGLYILFRETTLQRVSVKKKT